jgi:hypothetical protein
MARRHPLRYVLLWVRRWLGTSKPTEWIAAITAMIGVGATISGAIFLMRNGFLDQKRSELEVKRTEISIQNVKLELEQRDLVARRDAIQNQISLTEESLRTTRAELLTSQSQLKDSLAKLADAQKNLAEYVAHEAAVNLLVGHKLNTGITPRLECSIIDNVAFKNLTVTMEGKTKNRERINPPDKKELFESLKALRRLNTLIIRNVHMDASDISVINALPTLRSLELDNCDVSDTIVTSLIINQNTNHLGLQSNPITNLPSIKHAWAIVSLDVSDTKLGDEALIPFFKDAVNLRALVLARTLITDSTINNIRKGQGELDNIQLNGTAVSVDGVKSLIRNTQPRHVFMRMQKDRKDELEMFLKEGGIKCRIYMSEHGMTRGTADTSAVREPKLVIGTVDGNNQ